MLDLIIHNGTVMTLNSAGDIYARGLIGISGDRLKLVTDWPPERPRPAARETIDARGGIIMPGLVNTHTHAAMSLFRGLADDLPLMTWLNQHIFPAEAGHLSPETVRWGTLLACAEMIRAGITTCCDGYFYQEAVAAAMVDAGLRAVLGQGVIDFPAPGVPDPAVNVQRAVAFIRQWRDVSPLIYPSIFCHAPYTCSQQTLQAAKAAARDQGVLLQIHAAETRAEYHQLIAAQQMTPIGYLDRIGLVDRNTLLVHAVWLDPEDIEIIAARGAAVSHNPESNMKLASGIAPVPDLLAAGVPVGLGTDGCASNNDLDLWREMDTAAKLHKVRCMDPTVMPAETVLKMATITAAQAIGLDPITGSLEPGKQADVIVIDTQAPHLTPLYNLASHLVYAAQAADVRHVVVAGRILMRDRALPHMDLELVRDRVTAIAATIDATR